jgi:hypothetical protein
LKKKSVHPKVKTYIRLGLAGLVLITLIGLVYAASQTHNISLTADQIQAQIDKRLPLTKQGTTVTQAQVELSDELRVKATAHGRLINRAYVVRLQAATKLRYDSGDFYLLPTDLQINYLTVNDRILIDQFKQYKRPKGLIGRYLQKKRDALANRKAKMVNSLQQRTQKMVISVTRFALERIPVYSLPANLKGAVIGLMIKDIEIKDSRLIVYLSFWQFGLIVLILLGLLVGLIALIVWCPKVFGLFLEFTVNATVSTVDVLDSI